MTIETGLERTAAAAQRYLDTLAWESELEIPTFLLKPCCERCTESFEPSQLTLCGLRSVCQRCYDVLLDDLDEPREGESFGRWMGRTSGARLG